MTSPTPPTNPWVRPGADDGDLVPARLSEVSTPSPLPRLQPQAGVDPPDTLLPQFEIPSNSPTTLWWVAPHGGAGETTLAQLLPDSAAADHRWPTTCDSDDRPYVVLVARTHQSGLTTAQNAIREWASGSIPIELAGLVLVADAPGRLPKPLRALADLVAGGVSEVWRVPWIDAWRLGDITLDRAPSPVRKLINHLDHSRPPAPRHSSPQRRRDIA
jgi:hypothetical protein